MPDVLEVLEPIHRPSDLRGRFDPLEELVACILSQHTADANSLAAFDDLRRRYPDWRSVADAEVGQLAVAIRRAGLANQKARTILGALDFIRTANGGFHLDNLAAMSDGEAQAWLQQIPGVGPKTAAIVACFALGRDVCPVDTHVHRVGRRLGLIGEKTGADRAHTELAGLIPPGLAYRLHAALIAHGRAVCRARSPRCSECPLAPRCPSSGTARRRRTDAPS